MFTDAVSMLMLLIKVVLMSLSRYDGFLQEVLLVVDLIASVFASSGVPRRPCWIHLVVHLRWFYKSARSVRIPYSSSQWLGAVVNVFTV